ncbi:MAG: aspartyl protease [Cyanosarcina radialis HA8281-LM2]|jgi:predicted aspartyl protease|nr:aspartyl protease [Cyanosarcina radialis HA8281-LM2]
MIQGYFDEEGKLYFEIDLIAADGSVITINALLDTGFTDWLAMDNQDIASLGWSYVKEREMLTAAGEASFNVYVGTVFLDGEELIIPAIGGTEVPDILLGLPALRTLRGKM